jgi:hypothetical protein
MSHPFDAIRGLLEVDRPPADRAPSLADALRAARGFRRVGWYDVTPSEIVAIGWAGVSPQAGAMGREG